MNKQSYWITVLTQGLKHLEQVCEYNTVTRLLRLNCLGYFLGIKLNLLFTRFIWPYHFEVWGQYYNPNDYLVIIPNRPIIFLAKYKEHLLITKGQSSCFVLSKG